MFSIFETEIRKFAVSETLGVFSGDFVRFLCPTGRP